MASFIYFNLNSKYPKSEILNRLFLFSDLRNKRNLYFSSQTRFDLKV